MLSEVNFLIPHMQQNINFKFLFKHLRVQLGQYKVSTDPSVPYIHHNLVKMTDCNFDQKKQKKGPIVTIVFI